MGDEAALRRASNGREPWGFRAARAEELLGVHAELVAAALRGERASYLVYLPMWDGRNGPFGISAAPASHALALTPTRLLLSEDRHVPGVTPGLVSVPLEAVTALGWGSSLMVGWLRLEWQETAQARSTAMLFRASTAQRHVQAVIGQLRASLPAADIAGPTMAWQEVWDVVGSLVREEIEPALASGEHALVAGATTPPADAPARRPRRGRAETAEARHLLATDRGLLIARTGRAGARAGTFGTDVLFIPWWRA